MIVSAIFTFSCATTMKISQHYFTFPFYIPRVYALFENWPLYLYNYIFRRKQPAQYRLRNGYRLIDGTGTLAGTIAAVFVRQEYGPMQKFQTILDIGANMGSFMVYAAQSCPDAKIYCYEPVQQNFMFLTQNIAINLLEARVNAFQYAVVAMGGKKNIALDTSPLHSFFLVGEGNAHQEVDCMTLRNVFIRHGLERVDLLKMNCEGAEYEILENSSHSDFKRILNIRLEYHNLDGALRNGDSLAQFLEKQEYNIIRFTRYRGVSGFIWASRK